MKFRKSQLDRLKMKFRKVQLDCFKKSLKKSNQRLLNRDKR